MNETIKLFIELFSMSSGFWLLFGFFTSFRIRRFIVKRYEQETNLLSTVYFKEHATFTRSLPTLISSPLYAAHLISFLWSWNYCREKKPFRDIKDANEVIRHFSKKEIRLVKRFVVIGFIVIIHFVAYFICKLIWPETLR